MQIKISKHALESIIEKSKEQHRMIAELSTHGYEGKKQRKILND